MVIDSGSLEELIKDLSYPKDKATELRNAFDKDGLFDIVAILEGHVAGYAKELWFLQSMMA